MKRGNLMEQPLMHILIIVGMALVLLFGIRSVMNILSVSDDVELGDLVLRVRDDVQVFKNFDVGSYKTVSFSVPSKVERVCFFNPAFRVTARGVSDLLRAAVETSTQENVFIEPFDGFTKTTYFIEDLWVDQKENPLCFATKGKLSFTLETTLQDEDVVVAVGRVPSPS